ncbi:MAG: sensor histidine kinase [Planctomycetales bacterium]
MVFNLLSNALKLTPNGGEIDVTTERIVDDIRVTVCDSGCGIDEDQLENVLENYFPISSKQTAKIQGTGLGLPLVRQISELHTGRAWCESNPGQGSQLIVELPIEQPRDATAAFNNFHADSVDCNVSFP